MALLKPSQNAEVPSSLPDLFPEILWYELRYKPNIADVGKLSSRPKFRQAD